MSINKQDQLDKHSEMDLDAQELLLLQKVKMIQYIWETECDNIFNGEINKQSPSNEPSLPNATPDETSFPKLTKRQINLMSEANQKKSDPFLVTIRPNETFAASTTFQFVNFASRIEGKNRKKTENRPMMCNFCKNTKEWHNISHTHHLYDPLKKVLACPILRNHICEVCGGTGDQAHTLQYCRLYRSRGGKTGRFPGQIQKTSISDSAGKIRRN